jgi:hypothetical protein
MKIDPTERSPLFPRQAVDNAQKKQDVRGFDAVLQNTLQKTEPSKGSMGSSIRGMTGPQAPLAVPSGPENTGEILALKLLDRLEDYQKMLGDPDVTLKKLQPVVEQMEKQANGIRAVVADLPEGDPLVTIIQETIASIDQEIGRYYSGYYVDD